MSAPASAGGSSAHDGKSRPKSKKVKKLPNKVRVKLPSLESFEKNVEFRAEGPGRVIVRLERLMGSDRVRLTDSSFMATLLARLEDEENVAWLKRTFTRKKAERVRSRQLAINGLMEPGPDMLDLYHHPIFRVNRVLKRLAFLDSTMSIGQDVHPPPITPIEPFADDDTGHIFKNFPGHTDLHMDELDDLGSRAQLYEEIMGIVPSPISIVPSQMGIAPSQQQLASSASIKQDKKYADGDEEETEEEQADEKLEQKIASKIFLNEAVSLTEVQQSYGIPPTEDLKRYSPFRSELVETIYGDEFSLALDDMYDQADGITCAYERENLTADDFVIKLNRML